jgi:hypothetical protein
MTEGRGADEVLGVLERAVAALSGERTVESMELEILIDELTALGEWIERVGRELDTIRAWDEARQSPQVRGGEPRG